MAGFLSKLFGGKKEGKAKGAESTTGLVEEILAGLFDVGGFDLTYDVRSEIDGDKEELHIELSGGDNDLVTEKEGAFLDALQLFIKRVVQHQLPDARVNVNFDSNGFREEANKGLLELADRLKERCLEQGRSVYVRALPPKERKVIHQYLASDDRVRSRSVGDGLYKKIKIYPVKEAGKENDNGGDDHQDDRDDNRGNRISRPRPEARD